MSPSPEELALGRLGWTPSKGSRIWAKLRADIEGGPAYLFEGRIRPRDVVQGPCEWVPGQIVHAWEDGDALVVLEGFAGQNLIQAGSYVPRLKRYPR